QQQHEQLEPEEQVVAQPLEGRVDLQILHGLAPQDGRGDADLAPLELEEVEQHQRRDHCQRRYGRNPPGGKKVHRSSPLCRRYESTSWSNGTAVLVNRYVTPRFEQNSRSSWQ